MSVYSIWIKRREREVSYSTASSAEVKGNLVIPSCPLHATVMCKEKNLSFKSMGNFDNSEETFLPFSGKHFYA
jgi:RecB family endonuclease NucS